jgi:hypothetical protein
LPVAAVLHLQKSAGNGATAGLLGKGLRIQRAGPEPQPYSPPDGMLQLGGGVREGTPLGETEARTPRLPQFWVAVDAAPDGQQEGRVQPAPPVATTITPVYPAPGVYSVPSTEGRSRRYIVTNDVSLDVKAGEQEHSDDYDAANRMVYGRVVEVINQLAAQPPRRGPDREDVRRQWRVALHDALPPPLREDPNEMSPSGPWTAAYARMYQASLNRDFPQRWHSLRSRDATQEERAAHEIPSEDEAKVITGQIIRRGSQTLMQEAWDALPARP